MSHAVVRGQPNASQFYLDGILDEILLEQGVKPCPNQRENVRISQIIFHCMKKRPQDEFLTNGATGKVITNEALLKHAIAITRALTADGAKGKYAMLVMRNHQDMVAIYYAMMFAGLVPFMMDPNNTIYELIHFLNLIEPSYIFCDREFDETLKKAMVGSKDLILKPKVIIADDPEILGKFVEGYSDDIQSFQVSTGSMDEPIMLLPTSGSTGLPKAAIITNRGLVAQLPSPWSYHTQFPTPTSKILLLTTIQWLTFTMFILSCPVYHIKVIISPKKVTVEHVIEMLEQLRPTWTFLGPAFATSLVETVKPEQLTSLETLILLGAPSTPELMTAVKAKLPKTAHLCDGYGATETQGFIAIPDKKAPLKCNGWVHNVFYYKIVDEEGQELGINQSGELHVKGVSIIKGYHKHTKADDSLTPDGWYRTGDVFYLDENERISFVVRKKFSFKYKGCQVAPEEVERVIGSVAGVHESVVTATDDGPAAAVVLHPAVEVSRDQIRKAVDSTLSDHKRLHGGIAFVSSLPHTHTGKLKRTECSKLIAELIKSGNCF